VLKRVECKNHLSSVATLNIEFQTAFGSKVSTRTVHRKLHEMGFLGRAVAHKPKITMHNAKRQLDWCKACHHWTLEQWTHILWSDQIKIKFIYIALRTSADISKCCTETQPKNPKQQTMQV
jgi:hypothetical protein